MSAIFGEKGELLSMKDIKCDTDIPETADTLEGKALLKEWGLPDGLVGIGALALGYPDGDPGQAKPRKEGYTRVIR